MSALDAVGYVLFHPVTVVLGAGAFYMIVDVSTQYTEFKVLHFQGNKKSTNTTTSTSTSTTTHAAVGEYDRFCGVFELTLKEAEGRAGSGAYYSPGRTARMGVVGVAQGACSLLYFAMVNALIPYGNPHELSWPMAIQKSVVGFALNPLFFGIAVVLNVGMKDGNFAEVWPKMKQDFLPSTLTGLALLPVPILGYRLFSNPVHLILYNLPTAYLYQMAVNFFLNREIKAKEEEGEEAKKDEEEEKEKKEISSRLPDTKDDTATAAEEKGDSQKDDRIHETESHK